ncbi:MAG TPA: cupin [Acetobacteraceae bacterium]|nr:cupin [Acetobacteraceae bacterium]
MQLNADFSQRVAVHAARLPWTPSPIAGVDRRMLDRIGGEIARATTIVRYAPASRFSAHIHDGGEEFLVLDGVFSDEHGDYPAGSYIRNPPTSRHTPGSGPGCTIFVKLWQFAPKDRTRVCIDTSALAFPPEPERPGVEVIPLFRDDHEDVRLERWANGAKIVLPAPGGIELLVLDGDFSEGGETFETQSWLRLPPGSTVHATAGSQGARVWVKAGHLAAPRTAPAAA